MILTAPARGPSIAPLPRRGQAPARSRQPFAAANEFAQRVAA